MSELITYKEGKLLKATLKKACDGASELKVITGFFYFLAVKALYWGPRPNFGAMPVRWLYIRQ